jgi:hypothetical protein
MCQHYPSSGSFHQPEANLAFQIAEKLAERRLRNSQALGRPPEVKLLRKNGQRLKMLYLGRAANHLNQNR